MFLMPRSGKINDFICNRLIIDHLKKTHAAHFWSQSRVLFGMIHQGKSGNQFLTLIHQVALTNSPVKKGILLWVEYIFDLKSEWRYPVWVIPVNGKGKF